MNALPALPTLDARDLRLVMALAQARTTAKAAKILHLAQPSVSRALLALEDRLEVVLFDRTARGLAPTAAGARIAGQASEILDALASLEREVQRPQRPRRRIRLVSECYTAYHWLPSTMAAVRKTLDDIDLDLRMSVEHTSDPLAALDTAAVDAALVMSPCATKGPLEARPLMRDELVFVVAQTHPLATKASLTPEDLESTPMFTQRAPPAEARWFMREVFGRRRPKLDISTVPLTEAVVDLARAGMGIAVLTEWVIQPYLGRGGFVFKRLAKGPLLRSWQFVWRTELGDVGPRLYDALKTSVR